MSTPLSPPPGPSSRHRPPVGRLDETRCSVQALVRGDSPVATAAPTQRWVLIEQTGPWGRDALTESRFDQSVTPELARRSREENVRLLLVRRPGARASETGNRWAYADNRSGRAGVWWSTRSSDAELLDLPWDGSIGERATDPLYLVCTHGSHDACCALRGRPLAATLPAPTATDVWECSHLGGDRFAANVLVLPYGFYYGQVPGDGAELVAAHAAGQVALPWLRGRAGVPPPGQAAQHHVRGVLGLLGVDDLPVLAVRPLPPVGGDVEPPTGGDVERWTVTLAGPAGEVATTVESRPSEVAARLTCHARNAAHGRTWHVQIEE